MVGDDNNAVESHNMELLMMSLKLMMMTLVDYYETIVATKPPHQGSEKKTLEKSGKQLEFIVIDMFL